MLSAPFAFAANGIRGSQFANCKGGWIVEMGGCIAGCAHPLEKSAPSFTDASIHRLSPQ
jgi:hypothetical protein